LKPASNQNIIPPPPPLNLEILQQIREDRNKSVSQEQSVPSESMPPIENKRKSPSIMNENDIARIAEKIQMVKSNASKKFDNPQNHPSYHHRQDAVQIPNPLADEIKVLYEEDLNERESLPRQAAIDSRTFSFDEEFPEEQEEEKQQIFESIKEESEDFNSFIPSKELIVVDDQDDDDEPKQKNSPKFENDDSDLNKRDDNFEDLKLNKMLIENIENLEAELSKAHKRINYLEEYNSQLNKAKNDLYEEKEDLIKRSIEYEYIKQRLEEKEKRLQEIEKENARRTTEIQSLRKDNEN
jgi:DNA repair exonuclease SbcCD ATPase subunit